MERAIERLVAAPLSRLLLERQINDGIGLLVRADGDRLRFEFA